MAADPRLSRLEELLDGLRERLASGDARSALRSIFWVNDELGRLARGHASLSNSLKELQVRVNAVTVEVKRGKIAEARLALGDVDEFLERMQGAGDESKKEFIQREGYETN